MLRGISMMPNYACINASPLRTTIRPYLPDTIPPPSDPNIVLGGRDRMTYTSKLGNSALDRQLRPAYMKVEHQW